jgi:hypothetical protein
MEPTRIGVVLTPQEARLLQEVLTMAADGWGIEAQRRLLLDVARFLRPGQRIEVAEGQPGRGVEGWR